MHDYESINCVKKLEFAPVDLCLKDYAFNSKDTKGRRDPIDEDSSYYGHADPFLIDYGMKILGSKSYRRLQDKTQVFPPRFSSYVRNRLTHTNEVISYSVTLSQILGLNTNLCMAIAAGHDIGHTPFGHDTEKLLQTMLVNEGKKFRHEINSVNIAQYLERRKNNSYKGLNLSFETLEGILNHSRGKGELTINNKLPLEYAVVMLSDKFYIFSDYNDSIRAGFIDKRPEFNELKNAMALLGSDQRERIDTCIKAICYESMDKGTVSFSQGDVFNTFELIKKEMYNKVYEKINRKEVRQKSQQVYNNFERITLKEIVQACNNAGYTIGTRDLIKPHPAILTSLLTDNEVETLIPRVSRFIKPKLTMKDIMKKTSLGELIPYILHDDYDPFKPNLEWAK